MVTYVPANNTSEKPVVTSALPLPALYGEDGEFLSVMQHLNPSSHIDIINIQLTKRSTLAVDWQSKAGPVGYHDSLSPVDWIHPTTSVPSDSAAASKLSQLKFNNAA